VWGLQPPQRRAKTTCVRAAGGAPRRSRHTAAQQRNGCRAPVGHTVTVRTVSCRSVYHVARAAGTRTRAYKSATDRHRWAAPAGATAHTGRTPPAAARAGGAGRLVRAAPPLLSAAAAARPRLPPSPTPAGRRCHPPWCPPPVRRAVRWGMADPGDSARTPLRQATHPCVRGFVRQGPTPRVPDAAGVGGHARARRNDAMRVDAPPSVASSEHSRRAAGTGAGACGTVPLGGIGATPGTDADDVSSTDEEEAPGTSTALRARRGPTGARPSAMMAGGGAGVADGNGPAGGGTAGGGARAVAATTRVGTAGGPGDDTRASAIGGDHGGLLPRVGGGAPDSRPPATGGVPARPAPSASVPNDPRVAGGVPFPSAPVTGVAQQTAGGPSTRTSTVTTPSRVWVRPAGTRPSRPAAT